MQIIESVTNNGPGWLAPGLIQSIRRRVAPLLVGATLSFGGAAQVAAQSAAATGTLSGRVVDAESGRPIVGAQVQVVQTTKGATSAAEGRYRITALPAGAYSVRVSAIGHAQKTVTGVVVGAGRTATLDLSLNAAAVALQGLTVSAAAEAGSARRALDEQRTAIGLTSAISREEISRGPDDDAGEAVSRVSGVTVESGKYVSVRGLGERYTTTQLNGARLPSPEPDRRVVPLDLFPAGTLESITVSKTFTPDQSGDFTGAQVNLKTRSFGSAFRNLSFSIGGNDAVTFRDILLPSTSGPEWLGFASGQRSIPTLLRGSGVLAEADQPAVLSQFRNSWTASRSSATPNVSFSGSTGSTVDLGGRELNYLGALSYQSRVEAQRDEIRATPVLRGTETVPLNEYSADTGRRSILWGGVLNLSTLVGDNAKLHLNNTYDRTVDNEALRLRGHDEELGTELDITRLQLIERTILSSQLAANHDWVTHALDWSATFSRVTRVEPDRSELVYALETADDGQPVWAFFGGATAPTTRAFGHLAETSGAAQADYTYRLPDDASIKFGSLYRFTGRDAASRSFDFDNVGLGLDERALAPEEIFGGRFFTPGDLAIRLRSNTFGGAYTAREHLAAAYTMVDYPVNRKVSLIGGLRVESANVDVSAIDVLGQSVDARLRDVDLLPAAAVNYRLTGEQTLRMSATRTLSRPEYRELANITYRDYVGSFLVFGNPDLQRALIDNYDLRWETYPSGGEVMSVAFFAKHFRSPIERVVLPATGAPVLSFRNARAATNYGMELEVRRRLGFIAAPLDAFTLSTNATLVKSEVDFGGTDAGLAATSAKRALLGQAPYVVNLSLIYEAPNAASATVLLNAVGERISEVGLAGIPDAYERPRNSLDLALEYPLWGEGKLRLEAENLLDTESEIRQGTVTRSRYRTGRGFSLGVSFEP